ncbi:MAG: tRNA (adenosine(37)-N6)-threonylcarbamoyltransferase complex transferase subunit TsaD [Halobacteriovoraceae bacterium]|nr:tRNA (adenosine(37)-N6)-threonylcarbamoyltransferase complex transferase subunit TsaD [Halobacteriovoraceae bacterium]MCB9095910.1 tRNA (adenosine(37)-N6)-threonylcarbamoyltransferase complex transferase subunit TsaD [Halobacteriovoraceae bacterium]
MITNVLGIETSCDETSLCLLQGSPEGVKIIEHLTYSQIALYEKWGGVIPEIASRNHLEKLQPLLEELCQRASFDLKNLELIGATCFPGLLGPLLTGLNLAKTIALYYDIPLYPVNHVFAHLEAIHITDKVSYPYIGVVLSGGHTFFSLVSAADKIQVLASTIDDASGEAFDKGGKLMGLSYPAGKDIDDLAKNGSRSAFHFPLGLEKQKDNPNMSFSGLKTSLRNFIQKNPKIAEERLPDLCASYQEAIVQSLRTKLRLIANKYKNLPIVVGGGVACNSRLREVFQEEFHNPLFVNPQFCTDNGAMIANLAFRNREKAFASKGSFLFDAKSRLVDKEEFRL